MANRKLATSRRQSKDNSAILPERLLPSNSGGEGEQSIAMRGDNMIAAVKGNVLEKNFLLVFYCVCVFVYS